MTAVVGELPGLDALDSTGDAVGCKDIGCGDCKLSDAAMALRGIIGSERVYALHLRATSSSGSLPGERERASYAPELASLGLARAAASGPASLEASAPDAAASGPASLEASAPDAAAALAAAGCAAERAAEIVRAFAAGSCHWRLCVAFGRPWALLAVHWSQAGREASGEERAAIAAAGECVAFAEAMSALRPRPPPLTLDLLADWAALEKAGARRASDSHPVLTPPSPLEEAGTTIRQLRTELERRTASLERRLQSEALLRDISRAIRAKMSVREVLESTAEGIRELFDAGLVKIHCLRPGVDAARPRTFGTAFEDRYTKGKGSALEVEEGEAAPYRPSLVHRLARFYEQPGRTYYNADWARWLPELDAGGPLHDGDEGEVARLSESLRTIGIRSALCRATEWAGKVTGLVTVAWDSIRHVSPHEVALFESITDQIGHALGQYNLMQELQDQNRRLETELARANLLRSMSSRIRDELDPRSVMDKTAQLLLEWTGADRAGLTRIDWEPAPDGQEPAMIALDICNARKGGGLDFSVSGGALRPAAVHRRIEAVVRAKGSRTFCALDMLQAQEWAGEVPGPNGEADEETVRCFRSAGLLSTTARSTVWGGKVNGVVAISWVEKGRTLAPEQLEFFADVCETVGIALGQATLVQQAQQAARAKQDFLSVVTHEMRTPMQAVVGITDLLLDKGPPPEQREHLAIVRSCAQSLVDLVGEVLDAGAVERGGRLQTALAPMDLRACAEDVLDMLWPVAAQKSLALLLRMEARVPRLAVSDRGRIRQVLVNLIGNSVKFTDEGAGCITLHVEAEGCPDEDNLTLFRATVTDPGCGISDADQKRLFGFFTQLNSTKSRRHAGAGLGLFISQQIARSLGGDIGVVSTPGHGSTFSFTFRAVALRPDEPAARPLLRHALLEGAPGLRGRLLIVAVDEAAWGGTAAGDAAGWGLRVTHAASLAEAEEAVRREAAAGRGGEIAAVLLHMPRSLPPGPALAAALDRLTEALHAAAAAASLSAALAAGAAPRPAPVLVPRFTLGADPGLQRPGVQALRLPISARALHDALEAPLRPPPRSKSSSAASSDSGGESAPEGAEGAPARQLTPRKRSRCEPPIRILFAEDTPTNVMIINLQLKKCGFTEVQHAANGLAALEAARDALRRGRPFHVFISDIMMPVLDGLESLRRMQAEGCRPAYAISLSANVGARDRRECAEAGFDAFLAKPVRAHELAEALAVARLALAERPASMDTAD